jgi:diacylglycerol kinase (ATP)
MTVGLIINPLSGRRSGKGERLRRLLQHRSPVEIGLLEDFAELPAMLRRMAMRGVDVLAVSSGDGTIHAIQTELAENRPFPSLPKLLLLSHGTANMSAATLGFNRPLSEVARLLADRSSLDSLPTVTRPTLRAVNPSDGRPRHGMFLGSGAIHAATAYCQDLLERLGVAGNAAIVTTFLRTLYDSLFRAPAGSPPGGFIRSYEFRVIADGLEKFSPGGLLFLATTLDSLVLGARPFWGGRTSPMRVTGIPFPVPHFTRWVWRGLYGSEQRQMPEGAVSFCASTLEVYGSTPYVMDGEFFDPPQNLPLRVETGPDLIYIRG